MDQTLVQILEEIKKVNGRLDKMDSRWEKVDSRFDKVDSRLDKVDARLDKMDSRLNNVESRLEKMDSRLDKVEFRLEKVESRLDHLESQQSENTAMIKALRHAGETQKAQLDALLVELAKLSGEMQQGFRALTNMYGHHEFELVKLRESSGKPIPEAE